MLAKSVVLLLLAIVAVGPTPLLAASAEGAIPAISGEKALVSPLLAARDNGVTSPSPGYYDVSEFMMGSVAVAIFLTESAGSAYDWSDAEVDETLNGVYAGLDWWESQEPMARLSFGYELHIRETTTWEPIQNSLNDDWRWIDEITGNLGYAETDPWAKTLHFNNDLRDRVGTDWAFSMFVVDSDDAVNQGRFTNDQYAHAYFGGPWLTMSRYSSWAYNSFDYFRAVPAHETGHIFYATDEYDTDPVQYSGYLNCPDNNGAYGIMNRNSLAVSASTRCQIGWIDADASGVLDILEVPPETVLVPASPDPTPETTVTYSGSAAVSALPNRNPYGPANDVTISRIASVMVRVDGGARIAAAPVDGAFDDPMESYTAMVEFRLASVVDPLPTYLAQGTIDVSATVTGEAGLRVVEAAASDTAGKVDPSPASDSLQTLDPTTAEVQLWYRRDGGTDIRFGTDTAPPWSWALDGTALGGDGVYGFFSVAIDTTALRESVPAEADATLIVDTAPPVTTAAVSGPAGTRGWYRGPAVVALEAVDEHEVAALGYRVDGGTWTAYAGPFGVSGDGVHAVEYSATDVAGNEGAMESVQVRIDATPPAFLRTSPSDTVATSPVTISWEATDAIAGISRYEMSIDSAPFRSRGGNASVALILSDGPHAVRIRAIDAAGNTAEAEIRFTVDTNIFSPSGPYRGIPLYVVLAGLAVAVILLVRRRRRGRLTTPQVEELQQPADKRRRA